MHQSIANIFGILCLLYLMVCITQSEVIHTYEFENVVGGPGSSRSPWRSRASEVAALHLFKGDIVEMKLCLNQTTELSIADVEYSNDGDSDKIVFEINGNKIGEFETEYTFNGWGHHWNNHLKSGQFGSQIHLSTGTHILIIRAKYTDCYGTELDRLKIAASVNSGSDIFCGVRIILSEQPTPCAVALYRTHELPTSNTSDSSSTTNTSVRVEQLSYKSNCLDRPNVIVKFHSKNLEGTKIIAKSTPKVKSGLIRSVIVKSENKKGRLCETIVWQIGEINERYDELGPMWSEDHIDYNVNWNSTEKLFPSEVDPKQSQEIVIRYDLPQHVILGKGQVRFTVGLINITKNMTVGLQFLHEKKIPSTIKYITFTRKQPVMGWILPVFAISPSTENQLVLHFDDKSPQYIQFDFLRLEYIPQKKRTRLVSLSRWGLWEVRGRRFRNRRNRRFKNNKNDGMKVTVNGHPKKGVYEIVYVIRNPNKEILAIHKNGKIFPNDGSRTKKKPRRLSKMDSNYKLEDNTGITFGTKNISRVNIDSVTQSLTIAYKDLTTVKLSFSHSKTKSEFIIEDIRMIPKTLTFFSTHVTRVASAVNELIVDDKQRMQVMDPAINGLTGNNFKFENNANNPLFDDVSDEYEINFRQ